VAESDLPSRQVEEEQYRLHQNDVTDARYRAFVGRVVKPLVSVLEPGAVGLDFGCGSGPVGAAMLRERGFGIHEYDPIFAPQSSLLEGTYDFVLCSEVIEHFHQPAVELDLLERVLVPHGWLAVMTSFLTGLHQFASWHYRRDPTHVAFFGEATLQQIALDRDWGLVIPTPDVALFRMPSCGASVKNNLGS
jgi:SAM-dependent methyltransferase